MRLFILLLLTIAPMASAQETLGPELGNVPDLISTGYLMQVIGSLAIVFGAVVLMAFVVKRFNRSPWSGKLISPYWVLPALAPAKKWCC